MPILSHTARADSGNLAPLSGPIIARIVDLERWVAEIKLRAVVRIGELSRELETAPPLNGKGAGVPVGGKTKKDALRSAGISRSAAHRAEQIADQAPPKEKAAPRACALNSR